MQKRRQGPRSASSSPGASQEEVRATRSSNPQPRMDPTSECHRIRAECRAGKKMRTQNWNSKWRILKPRRPTSSCEKQQRQISWARTEPTSGLDAPAELMTSRKKKETAFLDIAREGQRGETNRRWRRGVRE